MSAEDKADIKKTFADTRYPYSLVRNTSVSKLLLFFTGFCPMAEISFSAFFCGILNLRKH